MEKDEAGVQDVLTKIEKFSDTYKDVAKQLHQLIMQTAPQLKPRLWYGMPGYAITSSGPVVLFFREDKYISFGLTESTNLAAFGDTEENIVEVAWYFTKLSSEVQSKVVDIVNKVVA
jgi:hypothetical protein